MPEYNEPNLGGGSLGGSDPFGDTPSSPTVSTPVDTGRSVRNIASIFNSIESGVQRTNRALERMLNTTRQIGQNMRRWSQGDQGDEGSGTTTTSGAVGGAIRRGLSSVKSGFMKTGSALTSPTGSYAALTAFQMGQQAVAGLDQRVNNAYGNLLANDRLAVLYQQTQGITQNQYYDNYRQPLQQFRLGAGGINTLLGLEAQTGIRAQGQAASIQGLSAASGYAYGTQEFAQMIKTLANPMVNNRMTMTLGTGLYGPGGSQRSMTDIFQSVVRGAGLTNERLIRSGKQVGSLTRARLSSLGIPEDMHDLILQYAEENVQFQRKTGGQQGMYDPSKQAHRQEMGIEENFATQREETTRLAELRDEKFYNRQKDNMAALEKNTQAIIGLQTSMEEFFSSVIGKRISYRGGMVARAARGLLGVGMIGAGIATGVSAGWTGVGLLAAGGLISAGVSGLAGTMQGGPIGDPVERGSNRNNGLKTKATPSNLSGVNSTFKSRLEQMMNDNPNVSVTQGFRSSAEQRQLFYSRYTKSEEPTGVYWNGSYWKKNPSSPDAAPPGMSMHELGLAVDVGGDLSWVQQNAHKYGLKTFANAGEPWHVQPVEVPNTRREYEELGAPWGRPLGAASFDPKSKFEARSWHSPQDRQRAMFSRGMQTAIAAASGGAGAPGRPATFSNRTRGNLVKGFPAASDIPAGFMFRTTPSYGGWGYYVPKDFTDADLEALHRREQPSWFVGPITNSHGTFYGGFSMNDYNWNRAKKGLAAKGIDTSNWKPNANDTIARQKMAAEYLLEELWAHNGWEPIVRGTVDWPGVGRLASVALPNVTKPETVHSSRIGDPIGAPTRGSSSPSIISSGDTITIAPNIYIQSTGSTDVDARRAAEEFSRIFSQNLKLAALRRS